MRIVELEVVETVGQSPSFVLSPRIFTGDECRTTHERRVEKESISITTDRIESNLCVGSTLFIFLNHFRFSYHRLSLSNCFCWFYYAAIRVYNYQGFLFQIDTSKHLLLDFTVRKESYFLFHFMFMANSAFEGKSTVFNEISLLFQMILLYHFEEL